MNILIFGAGAIGSLFGGLLSRNNNVFLVARKPHIDEINKNGLTIKGKTELNLNIKASTDIKDIDFEPDLIILTVKSYDTEKAMLELKNIIGKNTYLLSLQNGLDNISKIKRYIDDKNILVGITTQASFFCKPGVIMHTGKGQTSLGFLYKNQLETLNKIKKIFNDSKIDTDLSKDIFREMWEKAIINSCINPLTAFFRCNNGYLLKNPILENLLEKICRESTKIANKKGIKISYEEILEKTKEVIKKTSENKSSMLQSINKNNETEIDSINGMFTKIAKKEKVEYLINEMLVYSIKNII